MNVEGQYNPKDVECIPVENLEVLHHLLNCVALNEFTLYPTDIIASKL